MLITIHDVFGSIKVEGEYKSFIECVEKKKHNANLRKADLHINQIYYSNIGETRLDYLVLKIQGSRHLFCAYNGEIKIGCEIHSVKDWLCHGAYTNNYSADEKSEYMEYIKMYKNI